MRISLWVMRIMFECRSAARFRCSARSAARSRTRLFFENDELAPLPETYVLPSSSDSDVSTRLGRASSSSDSPPLALCLSVTVLSVATTAHCPCIACSSVMTWLIVDVTPSLLSSASQDFIVTAAASLSSMSLTWPLKVSSASALAAALTAAPEVLGPTTALDESLAHRSSMAATTVAISASLSASETAASGWLPQASS